MNREEHIARHQELHKALDELIADWILCKSVSPSRGSVVDLIIWSYKQTTDPDTEEHNDKT